MRTRPFLLAACGVALVVGASACGGNDNKLLIAGGGGQQQQSVKVWAVDPGDPLGNGALMSKAATGPLQIITRNPGGLVWVNNLSRSWKGKLLLATSQQSGNRLTAGDPGGTQTTITGAEQLQVVVINRGIITNDASGCKLATDVERARTVGRGTCTVSDDGRWIASWPTDGGDLTIRDLRHDTTSTVKGTFTQAVALGRDARVLGIAQKDGKAVAKVIDATDGTVVKTTKPADFMQALPSNPEARAFVLVTYSGGTSAADWIETDGTETRIASAASGKALVPVTVADGVHYLLVDQDPRQSTLFHWSPGGSPKKLMSGELSATAVSPDQVLVTRQTGKGLQFWHTTEPDQLSDAPDLTLPTTTDEHLTLSTVQLKDGMVHAQVDGSSGTSYVRIDLDGNNDAAPVRNWTQLTLQAIDTDGTALLVGTNGKVDPQTGATSEEKLMVVVASDADTPDVRARAGFFGLALIHEGTIYFTTVVESSGVATVWKVPASTGDTTRERLYKEAQIAGAAWPEYGGGEELFPIDAVQLAAQANQSQSGGSAAGGSADGSGTGGTGTADGSGTGGTGTADGSQGSQPDVSGLSVNENGQIVDQNGNVIDPSQIAGLTDSGTSGSSDSP